MKELGGGKSFKSTLKAIAKLQNKDLEYIAILF